MTFVSLTKADKRGVNKNGEAVAKADQDADMMCVFRQDLSTFKFGEAVLAIDSTGFPIYPWYCFMRKVTNKSENENKGRKNGFDTYSHFIRCRKGPRKGRARGWIRTKYLHQCSAFRVSRIVISKHNSYQLFPPGRRFDKTREEVRKKRSKSENAIVTKVLMRLVNQL